MNIVDVLNQIWTQILDITSIFVLPDWTFVISLLPIIVLLGLVMPYLTGLVLGTGAYLVTKPRVKVAFEEGPRVALLDAGGEPVYPVGLPHCRRDALVYPFGTTRCERCDDPLAVICPMCSLGRAAASTPAPTAGSCSRLCRARWRSGRRPGRSPAARPSHDATGRPSRTSLTR